MKIYVTRDKMGYDAYSKKPWFNYALVWDGERSTVICVNVKPKYAKQLFGITRHLPIGAKGIRELL